MIACVAVAMFLLGAMAQGQAAGTVAPAPPAAYAPETVVATVDGNPVTFGELMFRLAQLPEEARRSYQTRPEGLRVFLRDVVTKEAVLAEARAEGVERDPAFARLLELKRAEVMLDLYARRTLLSTVDEAALRERYEAEKERFTVRPLVHLRYLVVTPVREKTLANATGDDAVGEEQAKAKAERLREEIAAKGNFAVVARRFSEDASAKDDGDLGWVEPRSLVPEVAAAAMTLPIGDVSRVLHSTLGYHVVEVVARRAGGVIPFDAVRELLLQEVAGEKRAELVGKAREDREAIAKQHRIEIFPERLP